MLASLAAALAAVALGCSSKHLMMGGTGGTGSAGMAGAAATGSGGSSTSGAGGMRGSGGSTSTSATGGSGGMSGNPADSGQIVTGMPGDSGTGGASDSGAAGKDGGASECPQVTFRMRPGGPGGASQFCIGGPCGKDPWVTVLDEHGDEVGQEGLQCGLLDCASCEAPMCPPAACGHWSMIDPDGEQVTWSLTQWTAGGTCSSSKSACSTLGCVPPGHYTAHFCADALPADGVGGCNAAASMPTCVDVPFDYPTTAPVQAVLDPRK